MVAYGDGYSSPPIPGDCSYLHMETFRKHSRTLGEHVGSTKGALMETQGTFREYSGSSSGMFSPDAASPHAYPPLSSPLVSASPTPAMDRSVTCPEGTGGAQHVFWRRLLTRDPGHRLPTGGSIQVPRWCGKASDGVDPGSHTHPHTHTHTHTYLYLRLHSHLHLGSRPPWV